MNLGIIVGRGGDLLQAETLLKAAFEHGATDALTAARDEAEAVARGETTVTVAMESSDETAEKKAWWCEMRIYPFNLGCVLEARGGVTGALKMYNLALVLDRDYEPAKRSASMARERQLAEGDKIAVDVFDLPRPPPTPTGPRDRETAEQRAKRERIANGQQTSSLDDFLKTLGCSI
jgi:hypothetical protein